MIETSGVVIPAPFRSFRAPLPLRIDARAVPIFREDEPPDAGQAVRHCNTAVSRLSTSG